MKIQHPNNHKSIPFEAGDRDKRDNGIQHQNEVTELHSFMCKLCKKTFGTEDDLIKHLAKHEMGIKFACDHCELSYLSNPSLKRHRKMKHELVA